MNDAPILPGPGELADRSVLPGLPDDAFEHDGLITKRHQRATAFAFLRPAAGELLWDVGTGSGAMAIEWCRAAPGARAIGLERNPERAARARRNAERWTPGQVRIIEGAASATLAALRAGGRVVAHGVTLETEALLAERYRRHGGSLARLSIEIAEPLGRFHGWVPARPVTQWACHK